MLEVKDKQEVRVKKAHIALMKHPETALYSGVMLMGKSEVVDGSFTAYTDGVNKRYCRSYLKDRVQSEPKLRGLILHENLHVALKQIQRGKDMFKEDRKIANMAADFVVNDIIFQIEGKVIGGVQAICEAADTPVAAIVGDSDEALASRIQHVSLTREFGFDRAMREPLWCIEQAALQLLRDR